jgi:hypothetical protein
MHEKEYEADNSEIYEDTEEVRKFSLYSYETETECEDMPEEKD